MELSNELKHDLERLLINNPDFAKVKSHVSRFNPIKVMGMEQMEIRHSNILGWLLNPRENHGLGDEFLKAFLGQAMSGQNKDIDALAINSRNLADANIFIEWKHIDLFIEIPDQEEAWCFVVENKLNSSQHSDQLTRYQETVDKHYKGDKKEYKKGYIFLTLNDEEADNDSFVPINYRDVVAILELILQQYQSSLSRSQRSLIQAPHPFDFAAARRSSSSRS